MIPNKNSEWMQRMMLTYAQTVGEAALDDTDNAAEVPTELDQLCKTLIRYAPEIQFVSDQNIAYGVHIAQVLAQAQKNQSENQPEAAANEEEPEA